MREFSIETHHRTEFINITAEVQSAVRKLGVEDGVITVFVPHTTAGITINENADPDVMRDMQTALDKLVPWDGPYRHSEGNAAAHVKAALMGSAVQAGVEKGGLRLGTWQGMFLCEFDGPRHRVVRVIKA